MTTATHGTLGELLRALSFASDLGMGQPMEHGLKTAYLGLCIADDLGLDAEDREAVFYGSFLKDIGCASHAAAFAAFFAGDELAPRRDFFLVDPGSASRMITWFLGHA